MRLQFRKGNTWEEEFVFFFFFFLFVFLNARFPLSSQVSRLVGHVNGRYGSVCHQPVAFVHRTLTLGELSGLYAAADVAIVGSIREGVNLAAMEFVAAQSYSSRDQKGVLLYSEFAGCASSFQVLLRNLACATARSLPLASSKEPNNLYFAEHVSSSCCRRSMPFSVTFLVVCI